MVVSSPFMAPPGILGRIVEQKRTEVASRTWDQAALAASARQVQRRDFHAALLARQPAIIAEIKKASPSKGVLQVDFDPVRQAQAYEAGGAAALSVLTDQNFFQGSLEHLRQARAATELPVLRKDFILHPLQVLESAAAGADAILLIAAVLTAEEVRTLQELAHQWGMAALVEVHDEQELDRALAAGARIIGVNNRNLSTFEVTLETSLRLARRIPDPIVRVAESGISSRQEIQRLQAAGFQAFLIGEWLMRSPSPQEALADLISQ
jgi:indole-3-glycerol phosphate synthase